MNVRLFYHSVASDWNHGNAHFLRGIATELAVRGHDVVIFEPRDGWSMANLLADQGPQAVRSFCRAFPLLNRVAYEPGLLDLEEALADADLVIVHEWNSAELVRAVGEVRRNAPFVLLFHDTHHRLVTAQEHMHRYDLSAYDGVLGYGRVLQDLYLAHGLTRRAWTWHEAADIRVFRPVPGDRKEGDLVWIGNWGDDERAGELEEFLIGPVRELGLQATVFGVRYPAEALGALKRAGIRYGGWLPNHEVPQVFSRYTVTVHVPRRPYVEALPGIPTIRPLEAMACGVPLVSSPWHDVEGLFRAGQDYLVARSGNEMKSHLSRLLRNENERVALSRNGLQTIRSRHTCAHRVDELLNIFAEVREARLPRARTGWTESVAHHPE